MSSSSIKTKLLVECCDALPFPKMNRHQQYNIFQGPRSNFKIRRGGGGTISNSIMGGHKTLFLTKSL